MKVTKSALITEVSNSFERCFIAPENPFSLDNPDLLVAKGQDLFGVYIPTYKEAINPDSLFRRVYLSQLSYGSKLNPILLLNQDYSFVISEICRQSFRHISYGVKDMIRFVDLEKPQYRRWDHFSEIQAIHYNRYRLNLMLSAANASCNTNSVFSADSIPLNDRIVVQSWNTGKNRSSQNYRFSQGFYVGLANKGKSTSFKSSFDHLMTLAFMSMYINDNGELFPTGLMNELGIVNTNWSMFDKDGTPNLYNRMLSFIGLTPVTVTTENEVERLIERFNKERKRWEFKRK